LSITCVSGRFCELASLSLSEMHRNLVPEEVEILPSLRAAALGAAENIAVETAAFVKIFDMVGPMKKVNA
jgi:hypothetical protein